MFAHSLGSQMEGKYKIKLRAVAYFADGVNIEKLFTETKTTLKVLPGKKLRRKKVLCRKIFELSFYQLTLFEKDNDLLYGIQPREEEEDCKLNIRRINKND